jgi:thiaminase (transcriptional activator TenA)
MKPSDQAWEESYPIYKKLINHPYNQEMMQGTLSIDTYAFYMEQDGYYLPKYAKCDAIIANEIKLKDKGYFWQSLKGTFQEEQNVVDFFANNLNVAKTNIISPAALGYSSYILSICASEPVELAVAAILPCLWLYREVGIYKYNHSVPNNTYSNEMDYYMDPSFYASVTQAINIFDDLYEHATPDIQKEMLEVYNRSSMWELQFTNDAYYHNDFFGLLSEESP